MILCSTCHAGCCRRFNVPLTGFDIIKIKKTINLEYLDFIQVSIINDDALEKSAKTSALFKFSNIEPEKYYALYLRKSIESKLFPSTYKCMFLQEWNNKDLSRPDFKGIKARCGIYDIKPLACTNFPITLNEDGLTGLAKDPNKLFKKVEKFAYNMCPKELTQSDFNENSDQTIKNLVLFKYEMHYFKFLAETWNQGNCDFNEFFEFLEAGYETRVLFEST